MQEIIADKKEPKNVIGINEYVFRNDRIYTYWSNNYLRVLIKIERRYYWIDLELDGASICPGGEKGFSTTRYAIQFVLNVLPIRVFIFNNQTELRKWWGKQQEENL